MQCPDPGPTFPLDLVFYIAAFLWDDAKTLQNCVLTCKGWHQTLHSLVFRTVIVNSQERLDRLDALVDASPYLASWIQEFQISVTPKPHTFTRGSYLPSWLGQIPSLFHDTLPELKNLVYIGLYENDSDLDPALIAKFASFRTVRSLAFRRCDLSYHTIVTLASVLPNLRHLSIEEIWHEPVSIHPNTAKTLALTSLYVRLDFWCGRQLNTFLSWIGETESRKTLRDVRLHIDTTQCSAFTLFLQKVKDIEYLEFSFDWRFFEYSRPRRTICRGLCTSLKSPDAMLTQSTILEILRHTDLNLNNRLRTIHLHDPSCLSTSGFLAQAAALPRLHQVTLSSLPSTTWRDIRDLYEDTANCLRHPDFQTLEKLLFVYCGSDDWSAVLNSVCRTFRTQRERGILYVAFEKGDPDLIGVEEARLISKEM